MNGCDTLEMFKIQEEELAQYIKDISSGNRTALLQFYHNYGHLIFAMILTTVKSRESAEEVMQDVLMAIVSHDQDVPIYNARGWLFKVIQNLSNKKAKEEYKTHNEKLSEDEDIPSEEDISENIENAVDQIEAFECLDRIERQCVMMCVYGQMKLPQVAEVLGIPYKKVCNKYAYAVRKLRKYYEERGDLHD